MSDDPTRTDDWTRTEAPRGDGTREWEVFLREASEDPLRHAGSVSAPSVDVAREQAGRLFGRWAAALWLCPADEVRRLVAPHHALDGSADEGTDALSDDGTEEHVDDGAEECADDVDESIDEPREAGTGADA